MAMTESTRSRTLSGAERRHHDAELIRRLREIGAWLGEHGDELEEVLNGIPGETLVPALRHLARIVRRMGVEPRLSAELQVVLDEMGQEP